MELKEAICTRRAVRDFTEQPLSEEVARELIDAAIQAAGAVNLQPWSFDVVRGRELLDCTSRDIAAHMLATRSCGADVALARPEGAGELRT